MKKTLLSVLGAGFIIMAISFGGVYVHYDSRDDGVSLKNYEESSLIPYAYAKKEGKGKDKAKKDKGQKKGHDKDRGPSIPGIPMAAAVIIGLGAIGAGAYFIKKK